MNFTNTKLVQEAKSLIKMFQDLMPFQGEKKECALASDF